jgi:hypothetical protein
MVANILQKHEYLYFKAMKFGTLYIYEFYIHKDQGSTPPPPPPNIVVNFHIGL